MTKRTDWRELGSPMLPQEQVRYLDERGIGKKIRGEANLRFLTPEETAAIFRRKGEGLLVPFSKSYGVVRIFDDRKPKWLSPGGMGSRIYEAPLDDIDWQEIRDDTDQEILIAEGPLKALCAIDHGLPAIAVAGAWNWQKDRQPIPGLSRYGWKDRTVIPVFDGDRDAKRGVGLPYLLIGDWLTSQGARVMYVSLPMVRGKPMGLDDFIAAKGIRAFKQLPSEKWDSGAVEQLRTIMMSNTEGGLARMFAHRYGDEVRYCDDENLWLAWNGTLWLPQSSRALDIHERMKETLVSIAEYGNRVADKELRKRMLLWSAKSDNRKVTTGAVAMAASDPRIRIAARDLDSDPYLLGVENGVLDLCRGELVRDSYNAHVTHCMNAPYDPEAVCERWLQFINEIMSDDDDLVEFLQRLAGYFLIGGNHERLIFFLYGVGRNGKSVFIETLLKLFGDYGLAAKSELIMRQRMDRDAEGAQPFLRQLRGKRLATASEVQEGKQLDPAVVKELTGRDTITVRGLNSPPVQFVVDAKFVVRCNHRPRIDGGDTAIWDRIVEIPFELRLAPEDVDAELPRKLEAELPGILTWAVEGALEYQFEGLGIPDKVRSQIANYREEMDSVAHWMRERVRTKAQAKELSNKLYSDYQNWCDLRSAGKVLINPVSQREFNRSLEATGYKRQRSDSSTFWLGLKLRSAG
ncbi:phage/plasmid primase, P4 family, partial [Steroidobacter sp.]|uniref:phage/plasmid primase, P4 family n=1 Tax=Steroidobacter sp. TaxID=1978227 RepID=UPI001A61D7C6